ncbi:MAG: hypothetical protein LBI42_09300 [Chitinispirillales bacterium]|jgi:hypothetical protein|nr:hypothetical protein [Chitinispirillales bacterium]
MKLKNLILASALLLTLAQSSFSRPVSVTNGIRHFGPITKEISDSVRASAVASLRVEMYIWLKDNVNVDLDTMNTVKNHALNKFAERGLASAEEKTFTKGRTWNLSLSVSEANLREALREHNSYYGALLTQNWERYQTVSQTDPDAALSNSIRALGAASLLIGVDVQKPSTQELRRTVQSLFDRIEVKSDAMVIEGRPGGRPVKSPSAKFTIDKEPLTGLQVTAFVQNGRQLSQMASFIDGTLALDDHIIPFVHNGSMLTLALDARSYIDASSYIRFRDLGIRLNRGQELSFIYKIPTLTCALNFKAFSPDSSIEVPREFSANSHVINFLRDSCNIRIAPAGAKPDLTIDINVEFSRKFYEELADESIVMKGKAGFKGDWVSKNGDTLFEKRREMGTAVEMGPYFHEAAGVLRAMIKNALHN